MAQGSAAGTSSPPDDGRLPANERERALAAFSRDLAAAISYPGDLPPEAAERAAADPLFLNRLVAERGTGEVVAGLVQGVVGRNPPKWAPPPSLTLIRSAAKALGRWAASGFGSVSEPVAQQRRAACLACPHLRAPGGHLIHKLAGAKDSTVCGLCSCAVDKKVRMPTETCPAPSDDSPGLNRWGEPLEP